MDFCFQVYADLIEDGRLRGDIWGKNDYVPLDRGKGLW
jgi:hypothetical protein